MNGQQQQPQPTHQPLKLEPTGVYLNGSAANAVTNGTSSQQQQSNGMSNSTTSAQQASLLGTSSQQQQQQQVPNGVMVDMNNNQIQHSPQLQAAQFYTSLMNATTAANGASSSAQTSNLIASLNAANYANFVHLQQQQQPTQQQATSQLDLFNNLAGLSSLLGTTGMSLSHAITGAHQPPPPPPPLSHQSEEQHQYDYMQKLLEEKEKLKELFNDPFNISLPISARLLDEG
jgi:hypothetical protein